MNHDLKKYFEPGKKNIILVYVLYLLGSLITVAPVIGAGFAFVHMESTDKLLRSHYKFAFRTFVIGLVAVLASFVLLLVFKSVGVVFMGFLFYIAIFIWFIIRSITAINYVLNDMEHPNPNTLWIK